MKNLFAVIAAALALSFFGGMATEAVAMEPAGHSFCKGGMSGPQELAARMDRALALDPTGMKVKLEKCEATPDNFLLAFQKVDPKAGLTSVSQLPGYIRSLVEMPTEKEALYVSACLYDRADGGRNVDLGCVTRTIRTFGNAAEKIYGNPKTGVRSLMQSCVNPGGFKIVEIAVTASPCIRVDFPSMQDPSKPKGTAIRFAYIDSKPLPGRCHKYQLAGESKPRFETPEECPDTYFKVTNGRKVKVVCDWGDIERNSSLILKRTVEVQNVSGSFYARAEGTNSWWLPREALNGLPTICWEMPDGSFHTLSVTRGSFVDNVATITADQVRTAVW